MLALAIPSSPTHILQQPPRPDNGPVEVRAPEVELRLLLLLQHGAQDLHLLLADGRRAVARADADHLEGRRGVDESGREGGREGGRVGRREKGTGRKGGRREWDVGARKRVCGG